MAHSKFSHSNSELYRTALNALIGSYTGSEADIEAVVLLSEKFDWERYLEQKEEAEAEKPEVIDVKFPEPIEVKENG